MIAAKRRQQGFGLLESLLVLALAAAITTVGLKQFQVYTWYKNKITLQKSVAELMQAGVAYYYSQCNESPSTAESNLGLSLTPQDLINDGYINSTGLIDNPFTEGSTEYTVSFPIASSVQITPPDAGEGNIPSTVTINNYQVQVTAHFSRNNAHALAPSLGGTAISNSEIVWTEAPQNTLETTQADYSTMNADLNHFSTAESKAYILATNKQKMGLLGSHPCTI